MTVGIFVHPATQIADLPRQLGRSASGTTAAVGARMKLGPSLLLPLSLAVGLPAALSTPAAQACIGGSFSVLSSERKAFTGVRFLTVAHGEETASLKPKFLIALNQSGSFSFDRPSFSLTDGAVEVPLTAAVHTEGGWRRKITLWVVSADAELVAGKEYTLTAAIPSIGKAESIRIKAAADKAALAPAPAQLTRFDITATGSPRELASCLRPPYYYGAYAWQAGEVAVVAFETDAKGEEPSLLGAWRGTGEDDLMLDGGHTEPRTRCITLRTYAPDLTFQTSAPVCRSYNEAAPVADAGAETDAGTIDRDAGTVSNDASTSDAAATDDKPAGGGCNMSASDAGKSSWTVWGLLAALWLRRRMRRREERSARVPS